MGNGRIPSIGNDWDEVLSDLTPFVDLKRFSDEVDRIYEKYGEGVNPKRADMFNAFRMTPLSKVRVVLLGQDPYPGHGVADGLAFSTRGDKTPASLLNIFKELDAEFGTDVKPKNDLSYMARQGVFLFNTSLLSLEGKPLFFSNIDVFEDFSKAILTRIDGSHEGIVFLLLGSKAMKFSECVTNGRNFVVYAPHPSPLSAYRGFFGSGVFSKTNEILSENGNGKIDWLGIESSD